MPNNTVLLISYLFPPVGGGGVQRNLKYVKYLPKFAWEPWVLTVRHINYYVYDSSLLEEVPQSGHIVRTESLDPQRLTAFVAPSTSDVMARRRAFRNPRVSTTSLPVRIYRKVNGIFAFPDPQVGWIPFAYRKGLQIIREQNIKAIVASMGPISSTLIAYLLWRRTGVPYLLDFRDGWTHDPYLPMASPAHRWAHHKLERLVLKHASAVTVYGEPLAVKLRASYPDMSTRVDVLPNGFDRSDLEGVTAKPKERNDEFRIVYSGSLNTLHEANFLAVLGALTALPERLRSQVKVLFVGQAYGGAQERVKAFGLGEQVRFIEYVPHAEVLAYLLSADASLLLIPPTDEVSITGKVFEYLMVGAPVLACVEPRGVCAALLRSTGFGDWIAAPLDEAAIAQAIIAMSSKRGFKPAHAAAEEYSRERNTAKLAGRLDQMLALEV
jgi:glycosyltransferase involved in cell wall biosynthesis